MNYRKKLIEVALPLDAINKASAPGEVDPARAPEHAAPVVGAAAAGGGAGGDLRADGGRPVGASGPLPDREGAGEGAAAAVPHHRRPGAVGEHHQREGVAAGAGRDLAELAAAPAPRMPTIRAPRSCSTATSCPPSTIPFAGGGAMPLEAQRLGLESYASDLNPVAVLINKAMIEIPPKFAGKPPVNPGVAQRSSSSSGRQWKGAQGLAEDVRYYGQWMRDEAEKRIGHLYPKVEITAEMAKERPDLKPYVGQKLTVIAWLWARTVKSPNPAFAQWTCRSPPLSCSPPSRARRLTSSR